MFSINPGPERSTDEKERLSRFRLQIDVTTPNLGSVIEKAKEARKNDPLFIYSTGMAYAASGKQAEALRS